MNSTLLERDVSGRDLPSGFDLGDRHWQVQVCQWLAGLFSSPPSAREVSSYRRGQACAWLEALGQTDHLAPGIRRMRTVLDVAVSDHDLAARLGRDHANLFAGVGGPSTVAPYESAYVGTGRLFQEPAAEMAQMLRRHDKHVAASCAEAADHVAVELALLAQLVADGHPEQDSMQCRLAGWAPRFAALCNQRDATGYFAGAAQVLTAFLAGAATAVSAIHKAHQSDTGG